MLVVAALSMRKLSATSKDTSMNTVFEERRTLLMLLEGRSGCRLAQRFGCMKPGPRGSVLRAWMCTGRKRVALSTDPVVLEYSAQHST
jgi:hypothetical protein